MRNRVTMAMMLCAIVSSAAEVSQQERGLPTVILRDAPILRFPGVKLPDWERPVTDCNSPAHWSGETLYLFNSAGHPSRSFGPNILQLGESKPVQYDNEVNGGRWIESTYKDDDGTLYGWYHNEPGGVCPERKDKPGLTAPRIGALVSKDDGDTWRDLGIVLEFPADTLRCDTDNFYFAGGNGDFSVILDQAKDYFYFFISTYPKEMSEQGVAVARMKYEDRNNPVGKVWKWHRGQWSEPGIHGHVTPIFPAMIDWHRKDANAFWGPSIHWNTHLEQYVILLNRAKDFNWAQEGIYVSFNRDLSDPNGWSQPEKILDEGRWYPQVIGLDQTRKETDKRVGKTARFFMSGDSLREIVFLKPGERLE